MIKDITVRKALNEALMEEMQENPSVFLMGEEVGQYQGAYKITQGLLELFGPQRVLDTPISEYGFAGIGAGAAFGNLRPVVEFMSFNFSMQAIDHIINSGAKTLYMSGGSISCPIVFRGPNGCASRVGAQHSQCFASWYTHCPGLKVVAPYDSTSAKILLKAAIRDPNPVVFLEHELLYGRSFPMDNTVEIPLLEGKTALCRRVGTDVTIVAFSFMVDLALKAAELLKKDYNIEAEVIDLQVLRPWDDESIIQSVKKTHHLVCVEEGWPLCGITSEIITTVVEKAFDDLDGQPQRVTGKDVPLPYARNLEKLSIPSVEDIVTAVLKSQ